MATISDRMETPEHLSGKNDFIHENQIIEGYRSCETHAASADSGVGSGVD